MSGCVFAENNDEENREAKDYRLFHYLIVLSKEK